MPWWFTPALIGGLMLYAKSKASAAFRWIDSDEASVTSMPIALLLAKVTSGDALPAAPTGFHWKSIQLSFAASPFAAPQTLQVNVIESDPTAAAPGSVTSPAVTPTSGPPIQSVNGFLTAQAVAAGGHGVHGFLTAQAADKAEHMGEVLDRSQYLYAPQTAPDFGQLKLRGDWCGTGRYQGVPANGGALGKLGAELRAKGLVLAPVGQHGLCKGDYAVTSDGSLHIAVGHNMFREIHPTPGRVGPLQKPFQAGFGIRRA